MDTNAIQYTFLFEDNKSLTIPLEFDTESFQCEKDSLVNAIINLDMLSYEITYSIEKDFQKVGRIFKPCGKTG